AAPHRPTGAVVRDLHQLGSSPPQHLALLCGDDPIRTVGGYRRGWMERDQLVIQPVGAWTIGPVAQGREGFGRCRGLTNVTAAAHRRRVSLGRARGAWAGAADGLLRAALHHRLSVPVRIREFHLVGGARVPRLRAVAAARPPRANGAAKLAVRADLADRLLLP